MFGLIGSKKMFEDAVLGTLVMGSTNRGPTDS